MIDPGKIRRKWCVPIRKDLFNNHEDWEKRMRLGSGLDLLDMDSESANASLPATPMLPTAAMPSQTRHIVSKLRTSFDACWLLKPAPEGVRGDRQDPASEGRMTPLKAETDTTHSRTRQCVA